MADHTAPDYYEQVAEESRQAWEEQSTSIDEAVEALVENFMFRMQGALAAEFGRATVRQACLKQVEDIMHNLAFAAADRTRGIMIDTHYKETRGSLNNTLNAVLTGMQLSKGEI